jgi:hypothetical protein
LIKVSSMAVTFKNKVTLSPGAMFRFGTISCIANVEGTLHRVLDPPERSQSKTTDSAPAHSSGEDGPLQTGIQEPSGEGRPISRGFTNPKNSIVHLAH